MSMFKYTRFLFVFFITTLAVVHIGSASAADDVSPHQGGQDTDLFMQNPDLVDDDSYPNVLIIVDNTANWNRSAGATSKYVLVRDALSAVFRGLPEGKFNIGLGFFTRPGAGESGGFIRFPILHMNSENRNDLADLVDGLAAGGGDTDQGSNAAFALALHEAYLYYEGMNSRAGHTESRRDLRAFVEGAVPPRYKKPDTGVCADNYVIFIGNGPPDSSENNPAKSLLEGLVGGAVSVIPLNDKQAESSYLDEYARFLASEGIYTYTIDVSPDDKFNQDRRLTELLISTANVGGGEYFAVFDQEELETVLVSIMDKIQAKSTVFAATSLPVSVNTRGTNINEIYMAMFRPNTQARPLWTGNLKLYEFRRFGTQILLADAVGKQAQNPITGFINPDVESFWTHSSNYWEGYEEGSPPSASDLPDGEVVEKGGAAQMLREAYGSRQIYTCSSGCTADSLPDSFTATTLSATQLGAEDNDERDAIIAWVRGEDNAETPHRPGATDGHGRPSIHGDVVHSSPVVINYSRPDELDKCNSSGDDPKIECDIMVFYGANDGQLRALRGSKDHPDAGKEMWSFIPEPFLPRLKRLRDNSPDINVPSVLGSANNKPFMVDGNITSYVNADVNGTVTDAYIFATMRRGGRFLVAFDVSEPESPKFMWQRGCAAVCDSGYAGLGQTWSDAVVRRAMIDGESKLVLIMGAGYDPNAEDRYPSIDATVGKGIYIIDAMTGNVIKHLLHDDMTNSFAATVVALNNTSGHVHRLYAPDAGGNIWRVDMQSQDPDLWTVHHLAKLGYDDDSGVDIVADTILQPDTRKFLYRVDVVAESGYYAILVGSGDREKPFETGVQNRFYMVKDSNPYGAFTLEAPITNEDLYDATDNLIQDGDEAEAALAKSALAAANGWFISLRPGEKVVGNAESRAGTTFFATNQPASMVEEGSCESDLGIARTYAVSTKDATAVFERDGKTGLTVGDRDAQSGTDAGFLPSPTYAVVNLCPPGEADCMDIVEVLCFGTECIEAASGVGSDRARQFWYKDLD